MSSTCYYVRLPDGTLLIYPEEQLAERPHRGERGYFQKKLYDIDQVIYCLGPESPVEQIEDLRQHYNCSGTMIDMTPLTDRKKVLLASGTAGSAVFVLLKEIGPKRNAPGLTLAQETPGNPGLRQLKEPHLPHPGSGPASGETPEE